MYDNAPQHQDLRSDGLDLNSQLEEDGRLNRSEVMKIDDSAYETNVAADYRISKEKLMFNQEYMILSSDREPGLRNQRYTSSQKKRNQTQ